MQKLTITFLFILIPLFVFSQDTTASKNWGYKGYSGGMFIHSGYVQSKQFYVSDLQCNVIEEQVKGATFGLGGKMSIYLNRHFRVGGEGYFSSCKYGTYKNSSRVAWGGLTLDLLYPVKKWAPFIGVTLGYGSASNLIFIERQRQTFNEKPAIYFTNSFSIVNPTIGVEFFTSSRISLLFKMDYMLNISKTFPSYPQGVRFYLGVHFYQKKSEP
ncbi:MAG: hypothetical protein FWC34_05925 [Bacteroidetes bacterium]|nr:hypothetical protein [Bacteroidota bacterium]MCL2301631.1 hypothetical protein [Lentimicrobiaceae bacterium]